MDKYMEEFEASGHTDFGEFMVAKYEYLEYILDNDVMWTKDLERLIAKIHLSGLLAETEFEKQVKDIYSTLNV